MIRRHEKWLFPQNLQFLLIICGFVVANTELIDPVVKEKLDNFINKEFLPVNHYPAVSIGITSGSGNLLYTNGYGLMNKEKGITTANTTFFPIGSISKSFAAIIAVKSLHELFPDLGASVVNTPIRTLIPGFNFTLNDRFRSEQTSFRDMLSHRVCSTSDGMATIIVPFQNSSEVAYRQRYAPESCGFRAGLVYNNGMYALISETIESITGKTYESLLLSFLKDLGMDSSTFVRYSDEDEPPNRAIPYYWRNGESHKFNPGLIKRVAIATAAGGVVSNAVDMSKYLQFFLNKGKVGDRQVVPEHLLEWLYETAIPFPDDVRPGRLDINFGYGLGLYHGFLDKWQKIGHGGSVPPFLSDITFYPELDIGIFMVTNQRPLTMKHYQLHNGIFDILRGNNASVAQDKLELELIDRKASGTIVTRTLSANKLQEYVGDYGNGLQGELKIELKFREESNSTELYLNYGAWAQAYLLATDIENKFLFHWDSDLIHDKFAIGESIKDTFGIFKNNATEFQIIDNGAPSEWFKKGVSLDILPRTPWNPESCGPENKNTISFQ